MLRDISSFSFLQTIINLVRQAIPLISVTVTLPWANFWYFASLIHWFCRYDYWVQPKVQTLWKSRQLMGMVLYWLEILVSTKYDGYWSSEKLKLSLAGSPVFWSNLGYWYFTCKNLGEKLSNKYLSYALRIYYCTNDIFGVTLKRS